MNDDGDQKASSEKGVACPECGLDVRTTHDTSRRWTHCSRVIPRILWIVLCLGLIGYWVSIGTMSFTQNQKTSLYVPLPRGVSTQVQTSLNPTHRRDIKVIYVSTEDMRDGLAGDIQAMDRVRKKLGEAIKVEHGRGAGISVESVQFGWKESYGSYTSNRSYSFGGSLLHLHHSVMLQDIRDRSTIGHDRYHWSWGDGGWSLFPRLSKKTITHDGAMIDSWDMNLINMFRLFSVCLICAWLIRVAGRRLGIPIVRAKRFGVVFMLLLLATAIALSIMNPQVYQQESSHYSQDIAQSAVYQINQLEELISDEAKLIGLCQELLGVLPEWENDELLLGQAWKYGESEQQWAQPTVDHFSLSIGHSVQLLGYTKRAYQDLSPDEKIPARYRPSFWDGVRGDGVIGAQWGPIENQKTVGIGLFSLVSIGVFFWMSWHVFHWCARFVIGRVQHRRVMRNQCVFCAYPLTQQATHARYPEVGS